MKRVYWTVGDQANIDRFYSDLEKSLYHFHPEAELKLYHGEEYVERLKMTPQQFYPTSKAIIVKELFDEGYDEVCSLDIDQIITGDLSDIWEGDYDVACVLNDPNYPIAVWDITHPNYYNNGLNVVKSKRFADHWNRLCNMHPLYEHYRYGEQDILNILASPYCTYKVRNLDAGSKLYGEFAKPFWARSEMKDEKIMCGDKQLCVCHFAGGQAGKNANINILFPESVVEYIKKITK
jgi:lipopolysaccharide biosynthesis glycosyltransferase